MKLISLRIENFRSILDSTTFRIDQVTCLVGKNESGKTAILHALRELKPIAGTSRAYNKEIDYPRSRVNRYKELHGGQDAKVVTSEWKLEPSDVTAVKTVLGPKALKSERVSVSKSYGQSGTTWSMNIDHGEVLQWLAETNNVTGERLDALAKNKTTQQAAEWIDGLGEQSTEELRAVRAAIGKFRDKNCTLAAMDAAPLPHFLYFGSYDQMNGKVALQQLQDQVAQKNLTPQNRVFLAFLEFAGIPLADIPALKSFEGLVARLEGASNDITRQIFEYWSQNEYLRVSFQQAMGMEGDPAPFNAGWILRTRIYNQLHEVTVDFDERSTGFVWFFSFLVLFSQMKKQHGNIIILLDEPGLSLHGKAQGDLLRYIDEKLKPKHQVIYTTHSPFMVPPDKLTTVRIVEDVVKLDARGRPVAHGTKVSEDVLGSDQESIFPLQGALGYEITQTLFVGKHSLLVEGPGDVLMLQSASAKLKSLGREGLRPEWTLCPVGGIGNIMPFVNLFGGANKLDVAVLSDYSEKDKQKLERLREMAVLREGRVLTVNGFLGDRTEADIEDLFGPTLYGIMVNEAFGLAAPNIITAERIAGVDTKTERIVKRVADLFAAMPPAAPEFDHYQSAYWLQQNPELWERDNAEAAASLERFEHVFKAVNALLKA